MFGPDLNSPGNGGAVGDEVGDGLHDVPAVLPPGQPRQDPKLTNHKRVLGVWTNQMRVLTMQINPKRVLTKSELSLLTNQRPVLSLMTNEKPVLSLLTNQKLVLTKYIDQ